MKPKRSKKPSIYDDLDEMDESDMDNNLNYDQDELDEEDDLY